MHSISGVSNARKLDLCVLASGCELSRRRRCHQSVEHGRVSNAGGARGANGPWWRTVISRESLDARPYDDLNEQSGSSSLVTDPALDGLSEIYLEKAAAFDIGDSGVVVSDAADHHHIWASRRLLQS